MPRYSKKYTKRTTRKRTYRKTTTKTRFPRRKTIPKNQITGPFRAKGADPFRQKMFVKLIYTDRITLPSPTGGPIGYFGTEKIYALNSLYDPDVSGVGHQPYGFDTMSALYRKYKVNGCLVELTFSDPSADGTVVAATIQPPAGTKVLQNEDVSEVKERPYTFTRSINDSGSQNKYVKSYVPIAALSGLTPLQFKSDMDIYAANMGANPAAIPKLRIAASNQRSNSQDIQCSVKLTYYCQVYDRVTLNQS